MQQLQANIHVFVKVRYYVYALFELVIEHGLSVSEISDFKDIDFLAAILTLFDYFIQKLIGQLALIVSNIFLLDLENLSKCLTGNKAVVDQLLSDLQQKFLIDFPERMCAAADLLSNSIQNFEAESSHWNEVSSHILYIQKLEFLNSVFFDEVRLQLRPINAISGNRSEHEFNDLDYSMRTSRNNVIIDLESLLLKIVSKYLYVVVITMDGKGESPENHLVEYYSE